MFKCALVNMSGSRDLGTYTGPTIPRKGETILIREAAQSYAYEVVDVVYEKTTTILRERTGACYAQVGTMPGPELHVKYR